MATPFCSIIVLNYFGEKIIEKTINALLAMNYPKKMYEVIIVDSNSKDKSRQIIDGLVKKHPNIKSIFLDINPGFSKGNNIGMKAAKGKYIILLNNDAFPDKNWLTQLVKVAESNEKIFAVTSKILITDNFKNPHKPKKRLIQNAGSIVFQDGYGRDIGTVIDYEHNQTFEADIGQYDKDKEVYAVCGAACLFRKTILKKIGYLDESFYFYYEDTEISERARLHGYKLIFTPSAVVYHLHAYSSSEWSPFFIYNAERGRLLHVLYNFPALVFIREYIIFTLQSFGRLLGISGLGGIWRLIQLLVYVVLIFPALYKLFNPDKKFVKKFKINVQYIKVSLHFLFFLPRLLIHRWSKIASLKKDAISQNYHQIITGKWYFENL